MSKQHSVSKFKKNYKSYVTFHFPKRLFIIEANDILMRSNNQFQAF
jgi:hypothetical protein